MTLESIIEITKGEALKHELLAKACEEGAIRSGHEVISEAQSKAAALMEALSGLIKHVGQ